MLRKFMTYVFVCLCLFLVACGRNEPTDEDLIVGMWEIASPNHVTVQSTAPWVFFSDGIFAHALEYWRDEAEDEFALNAIGASFTIDEDILTFMLRTSVPFADLPFVDEEFTFARVPSFLDDSNVDVAGRWLLSDGDVHLWPASHEIVLLPNGRAAVLWLDGAWHIDGDVLHMDDANVEFSINGDILNLYFYDFTSVLQRIVD